MDGARVLRIEIDQDQDDKVERWEYYGADQKLEKVGFSRSNDGKEDAWSYAAPDGSISRIEISTPRDGRISRTEHYENDVLVRAEEDTDGDGTIDKWEIFDAGRLASVAFDSSHRGSAERRLVYASGRQRARRGRSRRRRPVRGREGPEMIRLKRGTTVTKIICCLGVVVLVATAAHAQSVPTEPDPAEARVRIGPFWLKPSLALTNAGLDTNVYLEDDSEVAASPTSR